MLNQRLLLTLAFGHWLQMYTQLGVVTKGTIIEVRR